MSLPETSNYVNAKDDGITHINIYSKAVTPLGRLLSNFAHTPFEIYHQTYESVEAYWYCHKLVISTGDMLFNCDPDDINFLKKQHGSEAKKVGKTLLKKYGIDDNNSKFNITQERLKEIYYKKLEFNPNIKELLLKNELPFAHYYMMNGVKVDADEHLWTADLWRIISNELKGISEDSDQITSPYHGVYNIKDSGLTIEQSNQFIDLLQPQIREQAYVENKARTANRMFSFGLRWARKIPNIGEKSKQNGKGPRPDIVNIKSYNSTTYCYFKTDQNNKPIPPLSDLQPIINFLENKIGLDMQHYDSMLGNIYENNSFIHQHRDITESITAKNYPVVVINLGADGGLLYDKYTSDKELSSTDAYAAFEEAIKKDKNYNNRIGILPISNGGIYAFGIDGINRFTFNHRILDGIGNTPTNALIVPEFDDEGNKTGELLLDEYRITLTFRRACDIN